MSTLYDRQVVGTLHERVGQPEQLAGRSDLDGLGSFGRVVYWNGRRDGSPVGVYAATGPRFDYEIAALQVGLDLYRDEDEKGRRNFVGVLGALGRVSGDVDHFTGEKAGDNQIDAYSLGGYWTRFWSNDAYLDGVMMLTHNAAEAKSARFPKLDGHFNSLTASLEGGWPIDLGDGWQVAPEVQALYHHTFGGHASDVGGTVRFQDDNSLLGQLSGRVAKTWSSGEGKDRRETTGSLSLGAWQEFLDRPSIGFDTEDGVVVFTGDTGKTWLELTGSVSAQVSRNATLYGDLGQTWDVNGDGRAWTVRLGARFNW